MDHSYPVTFLLFLWRRFHLILIVRKRMPFIGILFQSCLRGDFGINAAKYKKTPTTKRVAGQSEEDLHNEKRELIFIVTL